MAAPGGTKVVADFCIQIFKQGERRQLHIDLSDICKPIVCEIKSLIRQRCARPNARLEARGQCEQLCTGSIQLHNRIVRDTSGKLRFVRSPRVPATDVDVHVLCRIRKLRRVRGQWRRCRWTPEATIDALLRLMTTRRTQSAARTQHAWNFLYDAAVIWRIARAGGRVCGSHAYLGYLCKSLNRRLSFVQTVYILKSGKQAQLTRTCHFR